MAAVFFGVVSYRRPVACTHDGYGDKVVGLSWCARRQPTSKLSVRFAFIFSTKSHFLSLSSPPVWDFFLYFFILFSHPSFNLFTSLAPFYLLNVMPFSILYVRLHTKMLPASEIYSMFYKSVCGRARPCTVYLYPYNTTPYFIYLYI